MRCLGAIPPLGNEIQKMSYSIPSNAPIKSAVAKLAPEGVSPDDAFQKLANKLTGELAKVDFSPVSKKEGSKPVFLKIDRKKAVAKFNTGMAGDVSEVPVRVLDTYDWLRETWAYADKCGTQGLVVEFPTACAEWIRGVLGDMKPRAGKSVTETVNAELVGAK